MRNKSSILLFISLVILCALFCAGKTYAQFGPPVKRQPAEKTDEDPIPKRMEEKILKAAKEHNWDMVKQILRVYPELVNAKTSSVCPGMSGKVSLLHMAAHDGENKMVTFLLSKGVDIDIEDNHGWTPIFYAAKAGQSATVRRLAQRNAKMTVQDRTPILLLALASGDPETAQILQQKGATIDNPLLNAIIAKDAKTTKKLLLADPSLVSQKIQYMNSQPLQWAVLVGDADVIVILLDFDAKPQTNHYNLAHDTLPSEFYIAVRSGQLLIAEILSKKLDATAFSSSAIMIAAAESGSVKMIEWLLGKGATLELKNRKGISLMHFCGSPAVVKFLMEKGLTLKDINKDGTTPLHAAAREGRHEVVRCMLDAGAAIDLCNYRKDTPLHYAASEGHLETVKLLLEKGADINTTDSQNSTPLLKALLRHRKEVAEFLIAKKADVKTAGKYGQTALHAAAEMDAPEIVKAIIKNGADVNAYISHKPSMTIGSHQALYYPIEIACKAGNIEIVKLLLKNGADLQKSDTLAIALTNGWTDIALLLFNQYPDSVHPDRKHNSVYALISMSASVFKAFIQNAKDINKPDKDGETLLHYAARKGNNEIVGILLKKGADINAASKNGHTLTEAAGLSPNKKTYYRPIEYAAVHQYDETVKQMIEQGADLSKTAVLHIYIKRGDQKMCEYLLAAKGINLNSQDSSGDTPLHVAVFNRNSAMANILVQKGVDINKKNNKGETALYYAMTQFMGKNMDIITLLLSKGADVKTVNGQGETLLHIAVRTGHVKIIDVLLEKGLDINAKNKQGDTVLMQALRASRSHDTIKLLVEKGGDVKAKNNNGDTTLLRALDAKCDPETIKLLIDKGVDAKTANKDGQTPLHFAARKYKAEMSQLIIDKGGDAKAADKNGVTPMHNAAYNASKETIELLLKHGANPLAQDKNGKTPRDYAIKHMSHFHNDRDGLKTMFTEITKFLEQAEKDYQARQDAKDDPGENE